MRLYLKITLISLGICYQTSTCAILFQDDFQNEQISVKNWTFVSENESQFKILDNAAFVLNNSDSYSALAVHRTSVSASTFTISAKISSKYPGSGLYFCFQEILNGYGGYGALLGDDRIYIYKFYPESLAVIADQASPFIMLNENRLTISKMNDLISIFCNGYFIGSVRDTEFLSGDVALIVPPLSEATFDDVIMENIYSDTLHFTPFIDEFLEKNPFGWVKYGNAITEWENNHFQVLTSHNQEYYTGIEIPLNSFTMKTSVKFLSGDSSSIYGFFVKTTNDSIGTPVFYQFVISGDKKFVIKRKDQEQELLAHQSITGKFNTINGSDTVSRYDDLELKRDQNVLVFYTNGVELGKIEFAEAISGAGLFVSKELGVAFDDFQISEPDMLTMSKKIRSRNIQIPNRKQNSVRIDLLGRSFLEKHTPVSSSIVLRILDSGKWKKELKAK